LATIEELHIRRVVAVTRSLRRAATVLGIDPGTLSRRVKRYEGVENGDVIPAE
jgi:NtrC-family two-component system response regulator AlgB